MKSTDIPNGKFPIPFGNNAAAGTIRTVPQASQTANDIGQASLFDGFPVATGQPLAAGGKPPSMQDFNGILYQISAWTRWQNAGSPVPYDTAFSAAINGYPTGAILASTTPGLIWLSLVDNNTTNPDGGNAAGWVGLVTTATLPSLAPIFPPANTVIWVRPDASDSNNGSANTTSSAFQTIAAAQNSIRKYAANQFVQIRLGIPGNYASPNVAPPPGSNVNILGDTANQGNYIIQGSGGAGTPLMSATGCQLTLSGVSVSNQGTSNYSVSAGGGGALNLNNVTFYCVPGSSLFHISSFGGGTININSGNIISATMGGWVLASGGAVTFSGAAVTFINNPTWTVGGVTALNSGGNVQLAAPLTIVGSAQGPRFNVYLNGSINTNGSGTGLFPGSTTPSAPYSTGGQYA